MSNLSYYDQDPRSPPPPYPGTENAQHDTHDTFATYPDLNTYSDTMHNVSVYNPGSGSVESIDQSVDYYSELYQENSIVSVLLQQPGDHHHGHSSNSSIAPGLPSYQDLTQSGDTWSWETHGQLNHGHVTHVTEAGQLNQRHSIQVAEFDLDFLTEHQLDGSRSQSLPDVVYHHHSPA